MIIVKAGEIWCLTSKVRDEESGWNWKGQDTGEIQKTSKKLRCKKKTLIYFDFLVQWNDVLAGLVWKEQESKGKVIQGQEK